MKENNTKENNTIELSAAQKKMKNKMILILVMSIVASLLFFWLFSLAYIHNFDIIYNLILFAGVLAVIIAWSWYSVVAGNFKDSLNPKLKKGSGNRSSRRKGR